MAASKHAQIRAAVATALATVAEGRVHQNRRFDLAKGVDSQLHVNLRGSEPEKVSMSIAGYPLDWATEIELVILARKVAGEEASDVADALWVDAFGLVMADQTLGGLAAYIEPGRADVEDDQADTSVARLTWSLTVQHRTDHNSISS